MVISELNKTDRVTFETGFQARLISQILKYLRNSCVSNTWKYLANILGVNYCMISRYKNEKTRLSVGQILKLMDTFPFLQKLNLELHIADVESLYQMKKKAGQLGGKIGGPRMLKFYPGLLQSQAKKASMIARKKYGNEFFNNILKKYNKIGGLVAAEKSEPTLQMRKLIIQNSLLGLKIGEDFKVNFTLSIGNEKRNVDFVYFRNKKIFLIEEVTDTIPYNKIIFAKILDVVELRNWLMSNKIKVPILFTCSFSKKRKMGTFQRLPMLALICLLERNIIPIINENKRIEVVGKLVNNEDISTYIREIRIFVSNLLRKKMIKHRSIVNINKNKIMNESERVVHEKLKALNLNPTGKIIIENNYGILLELDNSFKLKEDNWLVLVTKTNSQKPEVIADHTKQHVGVSFMIKTMFNNSYKILSVILTNRSLGNSKWVRYLHKYVDKVVTKIEDITF